MKKVFLFPGQGSQYVGMGKDFYRSYKSVFEPLFEEANRVLDLDMKEICFSGPEDLLTSTEFTQPAILIHSVGIYRLLTSEGIRPNYVAGHSVGQFAALVAAEVLSFEAALQIVRKRGQAMAAIEEDGAMLAVAFSNKEVGDQLLRIASVKKVDVAGDNSPTQIVFSGPSENVDSMLAELNDILGVRAQRLQVSQAFHSRLMKGMEAEFQDFCRKFILNEANIPIVLNCSVEETTNPDLIFQDMIQQCTKTVRWRETMEALLAKRPDAFIEVGPKKVLTGLMRTYPYTGLAISNETVMTFRKNVKKLSKIEPVMID